MLEKPDLQEEKIIQCLFIQYGIHNARIVFLPLGVDINSAVYRVESDQHCYFLKLRSGFFNEVTVELPMYLWKQGITQIISPISTKSGQLCSDLEHFKVILYPFIEGKNAYEVKLSKRHWFEFGTVLQSIHQANIPDRLVNSLSRETFSSNWREKVQALLKRIDDVISDEPVTMQLSSFLESKRFEILDLITCAEVLARDLKSQNLHFVVCHADIHAGNVLIGSNGDFYIVDWDTLMLAPKERDLMYVGGGLMGFDRTPAEEEALFYQAYPSFGINRNLIAYYRYERIIQDIAAFCEQIMSSNDSSEDRELSLAYLKSNFLPNNTIEIAHQSNKTNLDRIIADYKSSS